MKRYSDHRMYQFLHLQYSTTDELHMISTAALYLRRKDPLFAAIPCQRCPRREFQPKKSIIFYHKSTKVSIALLKKCIKAVLSVYEDKLVSAFSLRAIKTP